MRFPAHELAMYDSGIFFMGASRRVRLRDGSYCRIRRSTGRDRHMLAECFGRLSAESRRRRFFAAKPTLSAKELDFLTGADGHSHIALVAVKLGARGEETKALGFTRCIRMAESSETAEMSIAVADEAHRLGIGSALLDDLTRVARPQGIRRLFCEVLADNHGMRALAKRAGGTPRWNGDGTVEYDWSLSEKTTMEGAFWSGDPSADFADSLSLWLTMIEQAAGFTIGYYDALRRHSAGTLSTGFLPSPDPVATKI